MFCSKYLLYAALLAATAIVASAHLPINTTLVANEKDIPNSTILATPARAIVFNYRIRRGLLSDRIILSYLRQNAYDTYQLQKLVISQQQRMQKLANMVKKLLQGHSTKPIQTPRPRIQLVMY